jgi:hypothetical protein
MCYQENMIVIHVNDRAVSTVYSEVHVGGHHVTCCPGRDVHNTSNQKVVILN